MLEQILEDVGYSLHLMKKKLFLLIRMKSLESVTGDQGRYRVTNGNSDVSEHCSEWNSGFIVHEVIEQWTPENDVIVTSEIESESAENIGELIIPATAVVVSTSLASLCLVFILNTEWIRIATLNGGLALIGMVRRRDYDGEFQRGRVVDIWLLILEYISVHFLEL